MSSKTCFMPWTLAHINNETCKDYCYFYQNTNCNLYCINFITPFIVATKVKGREVISEWAESIFGLLLNIVMVIKKRSR